MYDMVNVSLFLRSLKLTGSQGMYQQNSTEIKCTDCGRTATVPFKPTAGKPVYCRECLVKHRTKLDSGSRTETRSQNQDNEKQAWSRRREHWK